MKKFVVVVMLIWLLWLWLLAIGVCGLATEVTIETSRGPVRLRIEEVEREVQYRERRIFPAGVGVWKFDWATQTDGTRIDMSGWMHERGFTWAQMWSEHWRGRGTPFIFELRSQWIAKEWAGDLEWSITQVDKRYNDLDCFGINLDCERLWNTDSIAVLTWLRVVFPRWQVFTGPLWGPAPQFEQVDGFMSFYRVTGADRFPEDLWWQIGVAAMYDKPLCLGVQPVTSGEPRGIVDVDEFRRGLEVAAYADGLVMWSADRLWRVDMGLDDILHAERLSGILAAIAAVQQDPMPLRTTLKVLWPASETVSLTFNKARALGRLVGMAGFVPAFTENPTEAELTWEGLLELAPENYHGLWFLFYDQGHPLRPPDIKDRLRAIEVDLAQVIHRKAPDD